MNERQNMAMYRLTDADLITMHPGGYPDILRTFAENPERRITYQVFRIVGKRWLVVDETISASELAEEIADAVINAEEATTRSMGRDLIAVLKKYLLPMPSMEEWNRPAATWLKEKA